MSHNKWVHLSKNKSLELLPQVLWSFQQNSQYTDLTIISSNGSVTAHKAMLGSVLKMLGIDENENAEFDTIILCDTEVMEVEKALEDLYLHLDNSQISNIFGTIRVKSEVMYEVDPMEPNIYIDEYSSVKFNNCDRNTSMEHDDYEMLKVNDNGDNVHRQNNIKVGDIFGSKEEVKSKVQLFSDTNFSPLVINTCSMRKSRLTMCYKCPYGVSRPSKSTGKRNVTSKYVGCPVALNIYQKADAAGTFVVHRADLEHRGHEVGEEVYAKIVRRKLTKDQEEAVKVLLETRPSYMDVAHFLTELTGRPYEKKQAASIVNRLISEKKASNDSKDIALPMPAKAIVDREKEWEHGSIFN